MYLLPFQVKVALPALRFLANALPKDSLVTGPAAGFLVGLPRLLGPSFFLGALGEVRVAGPLLVVSLIESLSISGASGRAESRSNAGAELLGFGGRLGRSLTIFLGINGAFLRPRPPVLLEPVEPPEGLAGAVELVLGFAGGLGVVGLAGEVLLGALGLLTVVLFGAGATGFGLVNLPFTRGLGMLGAFLTFV